MTDEQIKQLAEAIYKSLWDYKGLTRHEDMMPYFEDIIRRYVHGEAKKEG